MAQQNDKNRIEGLKAELVRVVGIHALDPRKYQIEATRYQPDPRFFSGDVEGALSIYADGLFNVLLGAMLDAKLDTHAECLRLKALGLATENHTVFKNIENFDPEMAAFSRAFRAQEEAHGRI